MAYPIKLDVFFKDHLRDFRFFLKNSLLNDVFEENTAGKRDKKLHRTRDVSEKINPSRDTNQKF